MINFVSNFSTKIIQRTDILSRTLIRRLDDCTFVSINNTNFCKALRKQVAENDLSIYTRESGLYYYPPRNFAYHTGDSIYNRS